MATESGFTTQKKIGEAQYKTVHGLGSDRFGTSVTTKALSEVNAVPAAITDIVLSQDQKTIYLEIVAHGARKYDVLRISSGALIGWEYEITEIIDVDTFGVINSAESIPMAADTAKVMRWVTSKADSEGNVNFSPGPTQFIKDSVSVTVAKDTVNSANTRGLPVEIVAANGTDINITAGDINVQTSHTGANPDSIRIGDGVEELQISAAGEALVQDSVARTSLSNIDTKTPALVGGKVPVDTGLTQGLTDAQLRATPVPVSGSVATGGLTDTELRATPVAVSGSVTTGGLTNAELRATPVPVSGSVTTGGLTNAELRATPVPISGALTNTELRATAVPVSGTMQVSDGTDTLLVNADGSINVVTSSTASPMTPTYQEIVNLTNVAQTFTAPANAKWCKVMADDTNGTNIRVKIGGAASASSGLQFQPGRSEDFSAVGDISVIAETAVTDQKIYVQFGA